MEFHQTLYFISFGVIGPIVVCLKMEFMFENGVLHVYMLEGISSVANFITAYEEFQ